MACTPLTGGGFACGTRPRFRKCACGSGRPADLECDWKVEGGTCDARICTACATKPAPKKYLCLEHGEAWRSWRAAR